MLKQHLLDLIGQDTEFFLWDKKKEEVIPSYKYFKPKEKEPNLLPKRKYYDLDSTKTQQVVKLKPIVDQDWALSNGNFSGQAVKVFRDGLAVEVNSGPVSCRAWIWQDVKLALACAESKHWPKRKPSNITFTSRPVVEVSEALRKQFPKDLRVLGCSPTFDAYKERMKTITVDPMTLPFRTSGAHLHSSFRTKLEEEAWAPITKLSDLLIGAPFTYIFGDELEFKRRTLYGQAGEFRFQTYGPRSTGVEYRVLSSRLYNHPGICSLFTGIWKYVVLPNYASLYEAWDKAWEDDLQEAINLGSPKPMEKVLSLGDKILSKLSTTYTIKWPKKPSEGIPPIWQKLRELNLQGAFPDAGVINQHFAEAHKGWNEYRTSWGI